VLVTNNAFEDVVVKLVSPPWRLGMVNGKSSAALEVCGSLLHQPTAFSLDAIGGAFEYPVIGHSSYIEPGAEIEIMIGSTPGHSYVIGDPDDFMSAETEDLLLGLLAEKGGETDVLVYGLQWQLPTGLHIGIWYEVAECLGLTRETTPTPINVGWATAYALVSESDSLMAYGITVLEGELSPSLIIEEGYWYHSEVISHEILHYLSGADESDLNLGCVMAIPGAPLALRRAPPELLGLPSLPLRGHR